MVTLDWKAMPPGFPTAITISATFKSSEEPNSAAVRPVASIFSSARSEAVSLPTRAASYSVPSESTT